MGFITFEQDLKEFNEYQAIPKEYPRFGVAFLDDALTAIKEDDLVLIEARTGGGKTQLMTRIAQQNALQGKKVFVFALEAFRGEVTARIKFSHMSQAFYTDQKWRDNGELPDYQKWIFRRQDKILEKFSPEVDEDMIKKYKNLNIFYKNKTFNLDDFESHMHQMADRADLVILDHFHFFDWDGRNEFESQKRAIKHIKDLIDFYRKPVVVVVHIRKSEKKSRSLLPDENEIMGSSDIAKVATRIIATFPASPDTVPVQMKEHSYPTYFRIVKNRYGSDRCRYVGLCGYDINKNIYSDNYFVGELNYDETEFKMIEKWSYPRWAKKN